MGAVCVSVVKVGGEGPHFIHFRRGHELRQSLRVLRILFTERTWLLYISLVGQTNFNFAGGLKVDDIAIVDLIGATVEP
jgi:hypothetical protein